MAKASDTIETLIEVDNWKGARKAIVAALRTQPESHWLLSRLALTYYEEHEYEKALELDEQALAFAPNCPLTLWGHAGSLEMLNREGEALKIYQRLIARGAAAIAYGECGEGLARARGLVADSYYRMATCYESLGKKKKAMDAFETHLDLRGPGCQSIYPLGDLRMELKHWRKQRIHRNRAI